MCVLVLVWWRCLGCAGTWVTRGAFIPAPGRANAEEASLDAGHVLLREVGVVLGGGVGAWSQQRHETACNHVRAELYGGWAWGRSVTFHSHRSVGIFQVRRVHLARQYIALPRPWLPLRMESSVSRDLRSHVPQMWGLSGSSYVAYVSRPGLCGGGA